MKNKVWVYSFICSIFASFGAMATSDYDAEFYLSPKAYFFSEQKRGKTGQDASNGFGYGLDLGLAWTKYTAVELNVRHVDYMPNYYESSSFQYGGAFLINFPITSYSNIKIGAGGLSSEVGNEHFVSPYYKMNVEHQLYKDWDLVAGFNYFRHPKTNDFYSYVLGLKYAFPIGDNLSSSEPQQTQMETQMVPQTNQQPIIRVMKAPPLKVITPEAVTPTNQPKFEFVAPAEFQEQSVSQTPLSYTAPPIAQHYNNAPVIKTTYTVQPGDHLYQIARNYNLTIHELKALNPRYFNGRNPNVIHPGETIELNIIKR